MPTRSEWEERARFAVTELLLEHLAAPQIELEARISDQPWPGQPKPIDPHLLTQARKDLERLGHITQVDGRTRGGSSVALWLPEPPPPRKKRAMEDTAARKRLLIARWRSWSKASSPENMPNLIGIGGEAVVHRSLQQAAPTGYRLVQPARGEVTTLFGQPVPGGSLDNAAWLTPMDVQTQAPTGRTFLVPIEVKNVRHWLYPNHYEVHQLLYKSALLATQHPDYSVLPILVCRKAHPRTLWMASDLGFLVFQTHSQYVMPNERVSPEHFAEVQTELGLLDLEQTDAANPRLVEWLSTVVQREAATFADRWRDLGANYSAEYGELRRPGTYFNRRVPLLTALRADVERRTGSPTRSWAGEPDEHWDDYH